MNYIKIIEPRFHDNTILIASWKVGDINQIKIDWHEYPDDYYMTGEQIRKHDTTLVPNRHGFNSMMYVVPIDEVIKCKDLLLESL